MSPIVTPEFAPPGLAIDELLEERKRLDTLLDAAMALFAEYEEGLNARWKGASPQEISALTTERMAMEEELGIVALVDRLEAIGHLLRLLRDEQRAA